uniref:Endoplasmic reticulum lectin 1 n=1 Tax=Tetranychus urticae TaxID=32264 RepID=T1JYV6_TETUR
MIITTVIKCQWILLIIIGTLIVPICLLNQLTDHGKESFNNFKTLNDFYYKINWLGPLDKVKNDKTLSKVPSSQDESLSLITANKERYHCILPKTKPKNVKGSKKDRSDRLNPFQMLLPLFTREICSFRLEPYWSYELCHGKFIRQFHDESTSQKAYSQEYYLGKFDLSQLKESELEYDEAEQSWLKGSKPRPTVLIDDVQTPYIEINMTGGTVCDLNNRPRFTRVLYVCNNEARNELSSIKETYTCEYEAIVLTPLLCSHPDFRTNVISEESIDCYSIGNSPIEPKGYSDFEVENKSESTSGNPSDIESKEENLIFYFS